MIEETNSNPIPTEISMPEPKVHRISLYSKLSILFSSLLIAISLIVGWVLWLTVARDAVDNYINWFNSVAQPNSNLKISFNELSIIVFIVSGLASILIAVPFIFIKNKNSMSALFSLISFIFSMIIVITFVVFFMFRYKTFVFLANKEDGDVINTTGNFVIAFLPWFLAVTFAIFLLVNSLWLTINITSKFKSNALFVPIVKPKEIPKSIVEKQIPDDNITIPNITQTTTPEPNSEQPITITVTNNTAFPQEQEQAEVQVQNNDFSQTNPTVDRSNESIHYTNQELSPPLSEGAYPSDEVPNTADTIPTNVEQSAMFEEEPSIYSRPVENNIVNSEQSKYDDIPVASTSPQPTVEEETISMTTNNSIETNSKFDNHNQGGFDVQNHESEVKTSNFNNQPVSVVDEYQPIRQEKVVRKIEPKPATKPVEQKVTNYHWTLEQIQTVWEKAESIDGVSNKLYRKDYAGAWMFRDSFSNDYATAQNLETYSWTIVFHRPANQQGTTELYNLDPMNIVNAKSKGQNYPSWKTKISSKGNKNVSKEQNWKART